MTKERSYKKKRTGVTVFLLLFFLFLGIGVTTWQKSFVAHPTNLWVGIGTILSWVGIGLLGFLITDKASPVDPIYGLGFLLLLGALGGIGYGIYLVFFAPSNLIAENRRPEVTQSDLTISMDVSPSQYSIGDEGKLVVSLTNVGTSVIEFSDIELTLPINFFEGFIIKYPTNPTHTSLTKGVNPISSPIITFEGSGLNPAETLTIEIMIVAFSPGDYSGAYSIKLPMTTTSELKGVFSYTKDNVSLIVLP